MRSIYIVYGQKAVLSLLTLVLPLLLLCATYANAQDKELGEASYNIENCQAANADKDQADAEGDKDAGGDTKDLNKCKPMAK